MTDNTINKIIGNNSSRRSKFFSGRMVKPKRDWYIILISFGIFIIIATGFDLYMYKKIVSGEMYVSVNKEELVIVNLNSDVLKKVLDNFEIKKTTITNLKAEKLVDPSI